MPTFIDESGCCGFDRNSKPYFRLVAVWFQTGDLANACGEAIESVRVTHQLSRDTEFKYYSRLSDQVRRDFFTEVAKCEFCFVAAHFDKLLARGAADKEELYRTCVGTLAQMLHEQYRYAEEIKSLQKGNAVRLAEKVIVDDNRDPFYFRVLKDHFFSLKSPSGASLVGAVKPGKSKADRLLQLADMVCGAVGAHLVGDGSFYKLIQGNCLGVRQLPETPRADGDNATRPS